MKASFGESNVLSFVCTSQREFQMRSVSEHFTHGFTLIEVAVKPVIHRRGLNYLFSGLLVFSLLLHLTWKAK